MAKHHHEEAASPQLLHPVDRGHRVCRRVRKASAGSSVAIHTRLVLQPVASAWTGTSGSAARIYAFESVLAEQPKKGVTLFLATPMRPEGPDIVSTCLVRCGASVVIKTVPQPDRHPPVHADNPFHEIAAMQHLTQHPRHPNIIDLLDCMQDDDFVYLVLPHLPGGDLYSYIEGGQGLPEEEARSFFRQMVEGLLHIKTNTGLAHHDVSLENVMISSGRRVVKMIDFGMSLQIPKVATAAASIEGASSEPVMLAPQQCRGKPGYLSPQRVREEPLDPFAADVWSLGVCLYTMLTGRPLYTSCDDHAFKAMARGEVRKVVDVYETYGLRLSPCAKGLVCAMLQADASKRPTLEEILQHPFLLTGSLALQTIGLRLPTLRLTSPSGMGTRVRSSLVAWSSSPERSPRVRSSLVHP